MDTNKIKEVSSDILSKIKIVIDSDMEDSLKIDYIKEMASRGSFLRQNVVREMFLESVPENKMD